MRWAFILWFIFSCFELDAQQFQLAPPQFRNESVFFVDETNVLLTFAKDKSRIYFTKDGSMPTEEDELYTSPIPIHKNITTITARVFLDDFLPSDRISKTFIKQGMPIKKINFTTPHDNYAGTGVNMLMDNKGGSLDHTSKTWLGYNGDTVSFSLTLKQKQSTDSLLIHILENPGAWIVAPREAEVFTMDQKTNRKILLTRKVIQPTAAGTVGCRILLFTFPEIETDTLIINIYTVTALPEWHPGKGKHGWFFVDEINVY